MKKLIATFASFIFAFALMAQSADSTATSKENFQIVEASCGQCQFKLEGKGCDLAVRIDGKAYYVDGSDIHSHGDAHAKDGMCNAVRKAKVKGKVENGKFAASHFELIDDKK